LFGILLKIKLIVLLLPQLTADENRVC